MSKGKDGQKRRTRFSHWESKRRLLRKLEKWLIVPTKPVR